MFDQLIFNALLGTLQADAVDRRMVGRLIDQIENFGPHLKQWYITPRIIIMIRNHIICYGVYMSRRECFTFVRPRIPWNRERFH